MRIIYTLSLLTLCFSACSEQAQPYEEQNQSISVSQERGAIKTH